MAKPKPIPTSPTFKDLTDQPFGCWVPLHYDGRRNKTTFWWCFCDPKLGGCGRERSVRAGSLVSGKSLCCGCHAARYRTHGMSQSVEFRILHSAIQRCTNPRHKKWRYWGGRGVKVCERWLGRDGLINFIADVGLRPSPKHTLDRFPDQNGNYEPGNVRWATQSEQMRNTRSNRLLTFQGRTQCLIAWAEELGMTRSTIKRRLERGWNVADALSTASLPTPKQQSRNRRSTRMLTFQGRTQCVSAWAEEIGIRCEALFSRLWRGWSVERALTEPVHR